jgi:hypothetical protein
MNNGDQNYPVGFQKPPKHSRFEKGQSGNPHGRPKGSQNPATILAKACRERIRVTINGKTRHLSKFEATMLQLTNKAASGDLRAIRDLLSWLTSLKHSEQEVMPMASPQENDKRMMDSIVERICKTELPLSGTEANFPVTEPSGPEAKE